jgi:hypothetical protein
MFEAVIQGYALQSSCLLMQTLWRACCPAGVEVWVSVYSSTWLANDIPPTIQALCMNPDYHYIRRHLREICLPGLKQHIACNL